MNTKATLKLFIWILILGCSLTSCHKMAKRDFPGPQSRWSPPGTYQQWVHINSLPSDTITALEVFNNVIYAASGATGKIYESTDNGISWTATASIGPKMQITSISVFNGKIYVGSLFADMYSSDNNGSTWKDEGALTRVVTSFAIWNNNLYSSSFDNGGQGVLKLNLATNKWEPFLNGLSVNPSPTVRASKVIMANNSLVAGTTDVFGVFDPAQQLWQTRNYINVPNAVQFPDYVIDMTCNEGSILAQIYIGIYNRQIILRSDDGGASLHLDTLGMKADTDPEKYTLRGLLATSTNVYSIVNQQKDSTGIWIQSRARTAALGTSWANNNEFLPGMHAYAMRWLTNTLFLATDNGLYYKREQ